MTTIRQPAETGPVPVTGAVQDVPGAVQQSIFAKALAAAQDGAAAPNGSSTTDELSEEESVRHLVLYSLLQECVMRAMDDMDRNRKAAADSDD